MAREALYLHVLVFVLSKFLQYRWPNRERRIQLPNRERRIEGTVVLMPKNVLAYNDVRAATFDDIKELLGLGGISLRLVSSIHGEPENRMQGKQGRPAYLNNWICETASLHAEEAILNVSFDWEEDIVEEIGAIIVKNMHTNEFYLKTITLENVPLHGKIHFVCNSWIYNAANYNYDRIFFTNKALLPSQTPEPLGYYREQELANLRGDGSHGTAAMREKWDRIYDYDFYNDLGDPDSDFNNSRTVLGGSAQYPYPRRVKTGRRPTKTEPISESRLSLSMGLDIYVPRDEMFGHLKISDFLGNTLKGIIQALAAAANSMRHADHEFDTFNDVVNLFGGGHKLVNLAINNFIEVMPNEISTELMNYDAGFLIFPMPQVIRVNKLAWQSDEEFAREMLAGVNPVDIRCYQELSAASELDRMLSTDGNNIHKFMVKEAIKNKKLFILDHHGTIMPFLRRINETSTKTYATRTLLYLEDDGTLTPLAIELSLPHPSGDEFGEISKICTPAEHGAEGSIWQLAKAYVAVNDSGVHQLISHWLNTHAVIEPFIIATNRQLSSLHPVYRLLHPHFRDTMYINALARQVLINAGGVIETTFFPGKYAMKMSSAAYKNWVFTDQALPADLIKRGMAVADDRSPHGVKLTIEDYPYAVGGLEIWSAIKNWVKDYCMFYYKKDETVQTDSELQKWWNDVVNEGHGDKKNELWWPKMNSISELTEACTIIIWIASALHAAVNFGQYAYAGYPPNRPTLSRKLLPEPETPEYDMLETMPEKAFLETITDQWKSIKVLAIIQTLSKHCSDEVYLGNPTSPEWTGDEGPKISFEKFGEKLEEIKLKITAMNNDEKWKNRVGLANMPYTLLYPSSEKGMTGMGIPNSVSI